MKHDKITAETLETAALYSLGALSQIEARAFEIHMRDECPACSDAYSQFDGVVQELGFSASEAVPSPYLRDILISRLEKEPRSTSRVIPFPDQEKPDAAVQPSAPKTTMRTFIPWAIAASLAVFTLVSFFAWRQTDRQNAALERDLASVQNQLDKYRSQPDPQNIRLIKLAGQESAPNATAEIYWDTTTNRWIVTASLPPPPPGKVYQLWFVTPDTQISAGLIKPDQSGQGLALVPGPSNVSVVSAAAITLEPEGGSEKPTLPILAAGKVS